MEDLFYTCDKIAPIDYKYVEEALSSTYRKIQNPNIFVSNTRCSFEYSEFFKKLKRDLNCHRPLYLKWPANMLYDWHIDGWTRKVSLNIPLVSSDKSLTFFRTPNEGTFYNLHQVNYSMYLPTILNVKHEHCVINYSNEDRYVINMSFLVSDYETVLEYFKNLR
jgi:hypothetical protein